MTRPVAPGTRVLAAGLAISATITMVGAMADGMSGEDMASVPPPVAVTPAASPSTDSALPLSATPLSVVVVGVPGPAPQVVATPPAPTPVRPRPETTTNASR